MAGRVGDPPFPLWSNSPFTPSPKAEAVTEEAEGGKRERGPFAFAGRSMQANVCVQREEGIKCPFPLLRGCAKWVSLSLPWSMPKHM